MKNLIKIIGLVFIAITIANLVFFIIGKINPFAFWFVMGLCALSSYMLSKIRKP